MISRRREAGKRQADDTKERGRQAAEATRQAIVTADGGGNNMLMVSACETAVKLSLTAASQERLPSVLACHNSQFWA